MTIEIFTSFTKNVKWKKKKKKKKKKKLNAFLIKNAFVCMLD